MVVSNFRAALAAAQHQWPRSPVKSKANVERLAQGCAGWFGDSLGLPRETNLVQTSRPASLRPAA